MKNLISKEEKDRIDSFCKYYEITDYSINSDGAIDVNGNVIITASDFCELPVRFGKVWQGQWWV